MWMGLLSFFRGIKLRWRGILIICLFLGIGLILWQWMAANREAQSLRMENDQIAQSLKQQNKEMDKLMSEIKLNREINQENREAVKKIRKSMRGIPYEVADKIKQDKEVADWSDNQLPDAVVHQLRGRQKSGEGNGNSTNSTSKEVGEEN